MVTFTSEQSSSIFNHYYVINFDQITDKTVAVRKDLFLKMSSFTEKTQKITKATIIVMATLIFIFGLIGDIGITLSC